MRLRSAPCKSARARLHYASAWATVGCRNHVPQGPGFSVDGFRVKWQGFELRSGFHPVNGLVLNQHAIEIVAGATHRRRMCVGVEHIALDGPVGGVSTGLPRPNTR